MSDAAQERADRAERFAQRVEDVRSDLTAIPDAFAQLALFRVAGTRPPDPDRRSGNGVLSRPPIDLDVFDLEDDHEKASADAQRTDYDIDRRGYQWRDGLTGKLTGSPGARRQGVLPTLVSWSRLIDGELWDEGIEHKAPGAKPCAGFVIVSGDLAGVTSCSGEDDASHIGAPTVSGECSFLLEHLSWVSDQQWFNELAEDVRKMRTDIRRAIGDHDPLPLQCLVETCGWQVESMADGAWFRCTGCRRTWSRVELHKLHERQKPKTLAEVAEITGRPISTLKDWARRRWIKPVARDHRGALYSLKKVQDFAVKVQQGRRVETSA